MDHSSYNMERHCINCNKPHTYIGTCDRINYKPRSELDMAKKVTSTKVKPTVEKVKTSKAPAKKKRAPKKVTPTPKKDFKEVQQDSTELNGEGNRERGEEGEDLLSAPVEAVIKSASEILREERQAAIERQLAASEERKANDKMITGTVLFGIVIVLGFTAFALSSLGII